MKTAAFTIALLMSGAAVAQTTTYTTTTAKPDVDFDVGVQPDADLDVDADVDVNKKTVVTTYGTTDYSTDKVTLASMDTGAVSKPSNANPERDARGIAVISDPAVVPAGWNGTVAGAAMGGPLIDPVTGEEMDSTESYPACTAKITDNCMQTYEVRHH